MASQVKILNLALVRIGARMVSAMTEDAKSALIANELWDLVRDMVLADYDWGFARWHRAMAANSVSPLAEFEYAYPLPADCVAVRKLIEGITDTDAVAVSPAPSHKGPAYQVVGPEIHTSAEEVTLTYTRQVSNAALWPAHFVDCFAWRLAKEINVSMRGEKTKSDGLEDEYMRALMNARGIDAASENKPTRTNRRATTYWHEVIE